MATENNSTTNIIENEDDAVISMVDYLKEEEELENDADAVLGDSDDKQCTYQLGIRPRQALYACKTCQTKDRAPACVCLACSYACHDGHDLYELYTKRNFRCDCGNEKFPDLTCKLCPEKSPFNAENKYNQNFQGLYCTCARPYPDPDDDIEDEMIQCVICEDWYHGRHLGKCDPSAMNDFQEMICQGCMTKHDFLWAYTVSSKVTEKLESVSSVSSVDVEKTVEQQKLPEEAVKHDSPGSDVVQFSSTDNPTPVDHSQKGKESPKPAPAPGTNDPSTAASDLGLDTQSQGCLLEELKSRNVSHKDGASFWKDGFRSKLCVCNKCMSMYKEHKIEFLTDESDTVKAYEQRGLEKKTPTTVQDRERRALETMGRVQQIEMVQGFNDMKSALSDYLKHFAENGKVVRAEDIKEFFSQMQARKRQKTSHTPAHFCR